MPRPRLTLGRLMAWIAFAAVNLAILGVSYQRAMPAFRGLVLKFSVAYLAAIYLVAGFVLIQLRILRDILRDPTWDCHPIGRGSAIALTLTGLLLVGPLSVAIMVSFCEWFAGLLFG